MAIVFAVPTADISIRLPIFRACLLILSNYALKADGWGFCVSKLVDSWATFGISGTAGLSDKFATAIFPTFGVLVNYLGNWLGF